MARQRFSTPQGFALLIVVLFLGLVVYLLARRGLSDVIGLEARYELDRWVAGRSKPDFYQQNTLQAEFSKALALTPDDPQLLEDLGRLYDQRVQHLGRDSIAARAFRQQSLAYYRQAALARPTSPFAALAVASLKLKLGEVDREFSFFLGRGFDSGPWEPRVQLFAINLGLAAWQALPEAQRQQVRLAVNRQMSWQQFNQSAAILAVLKEFGRMDLLDAAAAKAAGLKRD